MTEPSTHLDLDGLADALAGEGDADGAAHLASCGSCASRLAELEAAEAGVVAALRALPDPAPPDDLAERLSAALAAEPPLAAPRATVTALPERAPRRRLLPAAAAAVLLVSGAGLGYTLLQGGDGSSDTASQAGGSADDVVRTASGTDYSDAAAVSSALPGVLAGRAGSAGTAGSAGSGGTVLSDGSAQDSATSESTQGQAPAAAAAPPDPLARLRTPEGLQDCLTGVLPPEEPDLRPLALDYAQYAGQPALAVVLPDPEPGKVSVYVVGPACSAADASVLGFVRVDAP